MDADYVIETAVSVPEVLKNIHKIIKQKEIKVSMVISIFITYWQPRTKLNMYLYPCLIQSFLPR